MISEDTITDANLNDDLEADPITGQSWTAPLERFDYLPIVQRFDPPSGSSMMRDIILRHISSRGKVRPAHNITRNDGRPDIELEDVNLM